MKTMFGVNDVIEFTARGRVIEYSVKAIGNGCDDCYVILVPNKTSDVRLYVSSQDLEAMGAKKVADHE